MMDFPLNVLHELENNLGSVFSEVNAFDQSINQREDDSEGITRRWSAS